MTLSLSEQGPTGSAPPLILRPPESNPTFLGNPWHSGRRACRAACFSVRKTKLPTSLRRRNIFQSSRTKRHSAEEFRIPFLSKISSHTETGFENRSSQISIHDVSRKSPG